MCLACSFNQDYCCKASDLYALGDESRKARTIPVWPDNGPVPTEAGTVGTTSTAMTTRRKSYQSPAAAAGRVSAAGGCAEGTCRRRTERIQMRCNGVPRGELSDHGTSCTLTQQGMRQPKPTALTSGKRVAQGPVTAARHIFRRGRIPSASRPCTTAREAVRTSVSMTSSIVYCTGGCFSSFGRGTGARDTLDLDTSSDFAVPE